MFKQELDRKTGKVRSKLSAAGDALAHHRHDEAMSVLVEADESAALLAGDDRFLRLEAVDAFLKEHKAASQELRKKIDASLKEKAAAEVSRTARDLADEAERLYEHHRLEEVCSFLCVCVCVCDVSSLTVNVWVQVCLFSLPCALTAFA